MTDELFDYFGKGSKKFEPLDDDLDLPEVSPKRTSDTSTKSAEQESTGMPVEHSSPTEVEPVASATDVDDDDVFANFGAGLFEDETENLPPRKQAPRVKPETKIESKTETKVEPKPKSVDSKPAKLEVAAVDQVDQADDSESGTWDFLAGMLGIGGKKSKPTEKAVDEVQPASSQKSAAVSKGKSQTATDELFNSSDDELDLAGWGDEPSAEIEESVAPAKKSDGSSQSGRGRKPRRDQAQLEKAKSLTPTEDALGDDDEDFVEFEVEELTPSARGKSNDDSSNDRPRRRRRPTRQNSNDDEVSVNSSRSNPRNKNDSETNSRGGGQRRGRGRGRGRNRDQEIDTQDNNVDSVASAGRDSESSDWQDDKPSSDSRSERSRGSRGRGRKRPRRQVEESNTIDDDFSTEDLEVSSYSDDGSDDLGKEESPKKSRRSRRSRSRSRGRNNGDRNDGDRSNSERESSSRGSSYRDSGRGQRDSERGDHDSERSVRRRGSRDSRDRGSRAEKPPQYAEVPTWDETIESMIQSNIKNHESSSNRGRGGRNNGRNRGGNNKNSGGRSRR